MQNTDNLPMQYHELLPLKFCRATCAGVIIPQNITFDQWKADLMTACHLREVADTILPLIIGQLLNEGEQQFNLRNERGQFVSKNLHDRYEIVAAHLGVKFSTISNWRSVERAVPYARRNRFIPPLLYSHIVKVAAMDDDGQEYWLKRAVQENMSCLDLQEAIEKERLSRMPPGLGINFLPNLNRIRVDLRRCFRQLFSSPVQHWHSEDCKRIRNDLATMRDEIEKCLKAIPN